MKTKHLTFLAAAALVALAPGRLLALSHPDTGQIGSQLISGLDDKVRRPAQTWAPPIRNSA